MSCFYRRNNVYDPEYGIHEPKFYAPFVEKKLGTTKKNKNIIKVVLDSIGLSLSDLHCGDLPKYDVHNMGAVQALKLGLLEGIKDGNFYELYLDEEGNPFILNVADDSNALNVSSYYSIIHDREKVDYCVIVRGLDPMPQRVVKPDIKLIENGIGPGVEVYGLGMFQYSACGGKVFDYNGCISYGDPNLQDTTKDELNSAFKLEHFESLIGYVFTCKKPKDVDVNFSDTSQVPLGFVVEGTDPNNATLNENYYVELNGCLPMSVSLGVAVATNTNKCDPCIRLEESELIKFHEFNVPVISVDQVVYSASEITSYHNSYLEEDIAQNDAEFCTFFSTNNVTRQLNIGQDFSYKVESKPDGSNLKGSDKIKYTLYAGVPVKYKDDTFYGINKYGNQWSKDVITARFGGSSNHIIIPFCGVALVTIKKPAIYVHKETDTAIGNISGGVAVVTDHTEEVKKISEGITLIATPIVTLDKPSNTAYCIGDEEAVLIDAGDCIQDNNPNTKEDLKDSSYEKMQKATSGKVTIDVTLPFLETDEDISRAASLLASKFSGRYSNGVSVVPGNSVSASDLGSKFKGGIVNKIVWSYQDKSFYKASITVGPFLTGIDSFSTSLWIRHTDQNLSREAIVIGDYGNGLEFKVYVRNIGVYTALNMTMNIIEVGDTVNVTIYNNPAETYYE